MEDLIGEIVVLRAQNKSDVVYVGVFRGLQSGHYVLEHVVNVVWYVGVAVAGLTWGPYGTPDEKVEHRLRKAAPGSKLYVPVTSGLDLLTQHPGAWDDVLPGYKM